MPKEKLLTRDFYRQVKSMDSSAMEITLSNIYERNLAEADSNVAKNGDKK